MLYERALKQAKQTNQHLEIFYTTTSQKESDNRPVMTVLKHICCS